MGNIFKNNESVEALKDIIVKHGVGRLLVVHGKNSFGACGADKMVEKLCVDYPIEMTHFTEFSANPKIEEVYAGVQVIEECLPQAILAIGGGSAMDVAKLMRYEAQKAFIPLIAIPTTSGTGAEATQFSVCYVNGIKESFDYPELLPNYTLLIPELTMGNNRYLTICTGFDAFAQAIESYWNIHATPESESYAEKAIAMLFDALSRFAEDADVCMGDYEWRAKMMHGANLAGKAINLTRTTAPHAMSYTLTSKYGYPHGHAVALTFPYFFEKNVRCAKEEYASENYEEYVAKRRKLVQMLGWKIEDNIFAKMKQFVSLLGLGYDAERPFEPAVVEQGVNLQRAGNNPVKLNEQIIREVVASIK